jgi:hypothetical protein
VIMYCYKNFKQNFKEVLWKGEQIVHFAMSSTIMASAIRALEK